MKRAVLCLLASSLLVAGRAAVGAGYYGATYGEANRLGAGTHFFRTLDDLDGPYEESGLTFLVSYQRFLDEFLRVEGALEVFGDGFAGAREEVLAPEAFVLYGTSWYGGVGAGWLVSADGDTADSPFFIVRGGYEFELADSVFLDLDARYQLGQWGGINEIEDDEDSDTVLVGATVRFGF